MKISSVTPVLAVGTLFALLLFAACKDTVSNITYNTPEPPVEVERTLTVNVTDAIGNDLTGYDINITGPTQISATSVAQPQFVFDNLDGGNYSITVQRDQYVTDSVNEVVVLPAEESESYYNEVNMVLYERSEPVTVNNAAGGTVSTAVSYREGISGQTASITFPGNAFHSALEDENGNVSFSLTRAAPATLNNSFSDGTVIDFFDFQPSDFDLNEEAEIEFPISIPDELAGNAGSVQLVLQPGNIPVELTEETGKIETAQGIFRRFRAKSKISRFQRYYIVPNRRLVRTISFSEYRQVGQSRCSEPVTVSIETVTGIPGPAARALINGPFPITNKTFTTSRSFDAVNGVRTIVEARNRTTTYSVQTTGGQVIEETTIKNPVLSVRVKFNGCHDSGGG